MTHAIERIHHRLDAIAHQQRLGHQARAERAALHPLRRATAIEIDFGVTPLRREPGTVGQLIGLAAAQLQRDRMFRRIEVEMARHIAVHQRRRGQHLGVQPRVL